MRAARVGDIRVRVPDSPGRLPKNVRITWLMPEFPNIAAFSREDNNLNVIVLQDKTGDAVHATFADSAADQIEALLRAIKNRLFSARSSKGQGLPMEASCRRSFFLFRPAEVDMFQRVVR